MTEIRTVTIPRSEWSLGANMIRWISRRFHQGDVLLEFGSGQTTKIFKDMGLDVYSIEEDEEFVGRYEGVNYIHAPIDPETSWYDLDSILEYNLPEKIAYIVVDGPTTSRRYFDKAFDKIFAGKALGVIIYDDIHREEEMKGFIEFLSRRPEIARHWLVEIIPSGQLLQRENEDKAYSGMCGVMTPRGATLEPHFTNEEAQSATVNGCTLEYPVRFQDSD